MVEESYYLAIISYLTLEMSLSRPDLQDTYSIGAEYKSQQRGESETKC